MHAFFEKTFVGSLCTQCGIISVCGSRLWWYSFDFTLFLVVVISGSWKSLFWVLLQSCCKLMSRKCWCNELFGLCGLPKAYGAVYCGLKAVIINYAIKPFIYYIFAGGEVFNQVLSVMGTICCWRPVIMPLTSLAEVPQTTVGARLALSAAGNPAGWGSENLPRRFCNI